MRFLHCLFNTALDATVSCKCHWRNCFKLSSCACLMVTACCLNTTSAVKRSSGPYICCTSTSAVSLSPQAKCFGHLYVGSYINYMGISVVDRGNDWQQASDPSTVSRHEEHSRILELIIKVVLVKELAGIRG